MPMMLVTVQHMAQEGLQKTRFTMVEMRMRDHKPKKNAYIDDKGEKRAGKKRNLISNIAKSQRPARTGAPHAYLLVKHAHARDQPRARKNKGQKGNQVRSQTTSLANPEPSIRN